MSNNNNSGGCSCLTTILIIALICLIVSYCNREDKSKGLLDNSIETIHNGWDHVVEVWNGKDTTKVDTIQPVSVNKQ